MATDLIFDFDFESIVSNIRFENDDFCEVMQMSSIQELPSKEKVQSLLLELRTAFFPTYFGRVGLKNIQVNAFVEQRLKAALFLFCEQIIRALHFSEKCHQFSREQFTEKANTILTAFTQQLPVVRRLLMSDIHGAYRGDPAAKSLTEIILCYPSLLVMLHHRLANILYQLGVPLLPRLINEIAHSITGIDIHPGAQIGADFFIDHGTGVVIGETAVIGKGVRIYQMVTLGTKSFVTDEDGQLVKNLPRHPIVEDNVIIYAHAMILGRITIGRNSIIGGSVRLTESVPENSRVMQKQTDSF